MSRLKVGSTPPASANSACTCNCWPCCGGRVLNPCAHRNSLQRHQGSPACVKVRRPLVAQSQAGGHLKRRHAAVASSSRPEQLCSLVLLPAGAGTGRPPPMPACPPALQLTWSAAGWRAPPIRSSSPGKGGAPILLHVGHPLALAGAAIRQLQPVLDGCPRGVHVPVQAHAGDGLQGALGRACRRGHGRGQVAG